MSQFLDLISESVAMCYLFTAIYVEHIKHVCAHYFVFVNSSADRRHPSHLQTVRLENGQGMYARSLAITKHSIACI